MPMRGSTICLIAFSAIMGMASVGLTSAHPHDIESDPEIDSAIEPKGDSVLSSSLKSVPNNLQEQDINIEFSELENDVSVGLEAEPEIRLGNVIDQHSPAGKRSDRPERADRRERGERRKRDGRVRDWPYFGDEETSNEAALEATITVQPHDEDNIGKAAEGGFAEMQDQTRFGEESHRLPPLPVAPVVPPIPGSKTALKAQADNSSGAVTKLTIPTLTMDDLSASFEKRLQKHILRFAESLGVAREKNEDRFAYFDDGLTFESPEDMRQAARLAEEVIAESGVISNVADFAADIIEDIEIEHSGDVFTIDFEGKRLGKLTRSVNAGVEHFNIEGLGSLMTFNRREIIGEDGKLRTRITLDIDEAESASAK